MLGFLGAPIGRRLSHRCSRLPSVLAPVCSGLATAAAIVAVHRRRCACCCPRSVVSPSAVRPVCPRCSRGSPSSGASYAQPAGPAAAGTHRAVPGRRRRHADRLPAAAAPAAVLQHHVPAVPVHDRGGRPNALLTRDLLDDAARQPLADRAGPLEHSRPGVPRPVRAAGVRGLLAIRADKAAVRPGRSGHRAAAGQLARAGPLGRILPYTTLIIAAFVPLAAGFYLLTTTAWTAAERAVLRRWAPPAAQCTLAARIAPGSRRSGGRTRRDGRVRRRPPGTRSACAAGPPARSADTPAGRSASASSGTSATPWPAATSVSTAAKSSA